MENRKMFNIGKIKSIEKPNVMHVVCINLYCLSILCYTVMYIMYNLALVYFLCAIVGVSYVYMRI